MEYVRAYTNEGCASFVLATRELLLRAWQDGPNTLAGYVESVDFGASKVDALLPVRRPFLFLGTPRQFFRIVRSSRKAVQVLTNARFVIDPTEQQREESLASDPGEGACRSRQDVTSVLVGRPRKGKSGWTLR